MIKVWNKDIVDIIYQGKTINKAYKGDKLIYTKEVDITIPPDTGTWEFTINQSITPVPITGPFGKNGDPKSNVVSWIRANSHKYLGTYNKVDHVMDLIQLDDHNTDKYADGTDIQSGQKSRYNTNVFMKMPTFWYTCAEFAPGTAPYKFRIMFSAVEPNDSRQWHKWDGNTLIGVYKLNINSNEGNVDALNNTYLSRANSIISFYTGTSKYVQGNIYPSDFRTVGTNIESHIKTLLGDTNNKFSLLTYEAHQVLALLGMCYHGTTSAREIYNLDYFDFGEMYECLPDKVQKTMQSSVGMDDISVSSVTTGTYHYITRDPYFWGLSGWFHSPSEYLCNITTDEVGAAVRDVKTNNSARIIQTTLTDSYSPYNTITRLNFTEGYPDVIPINWEYWNSIPSDKYGYDCQGSSHHQMGNRYVKFIPLGVYENDEGTAQTYCIAGLFSLLSVTYGINSYVDNYVEHQD